MDVNAILQWLHDSGFGAFMRDKAWAWPLFETLHFMGLCTLVGSIGVLDLRLLGVAPQIPLKPAMKFIPIAIFGFAINLFTGIGFFCGDPFRYAINIGFQLKMLLVVLAGLNALWFEFAERRKLEALPDDVGADVQAKLIAAASLGLWIGVIIFGRLIPYVGTG
jgi:hypothetical protein